MTGGLLPAKLTVWFGATPTEYLLNSAGWAVWLFETPRCRALFSLSWDVLTPSIFIVTWSLIKLIRWKTKTIMKKKTKYQVMRPNYSNQKWCTDPKVEDCIIREKAKNHRLFTKLPRLPVFRMFELLASKWLSYHTFVIIKSTNCPKEWENRNFIFLRLARFSSDNG